MAGQSHEDEFRTRKGIALGAPPSTVSVKNFFLFNRLAGESWDKFLCFNGLRPES